MDVPFNRPVVLPSCSDAVAQAIAGGKLSGDGPFTRRVQEALVGMLGRPTLLTTSATHALEMMALLLDIAPGDEVIVPSYTFVSTANAFALRGARIRFADNDARGNLLLSEVERLLTPRTRAVVVVHYGGASTEMDALVDLCARKKVVLCEDAAQAVGATYRGRPLGTLGAMGCLSFHDTKNITSGEGGALVLADEAHVRRAEILREKGTNRAAFLHGMVDKYTWVDIGSSYVLSDMSAAYLLPQLAELGRINGARGDVVARYRAGLSAEWERIGAEVLDTPAHNTPNHHLHGVVFRRAEQRSSFIAHMKAAGVSTPFHYVALHTSPFGARFADGSPESLPGCERLATRLVRLPLFFGMDTAMVDHVVESARAWCRAQ